MIVAFDFDEVLNDMLEVWVYELNNKYGLSVDHTEVKDWCMNKVFPTLSYNQIHSVLTSPTFWEKVKAKDGMKQIVDYLINNGHDVLMVTASSFDSIFPKWDKCISRLFPNIPKDNIIFTSRKDLILCDVLIDDYPNNLKNSFATTILFTKSYNKNKNFDGMYDYRVNNAIELFEILKEIEKW